MIRRIFERIRGWLTRRGPELEDELPTHCPFCKAPLPGGGLSVAPAGKGHVNIVFLGCCDSMKRAVAEAKRASSAGGAA